MDGVFFLLSVVAIGLVMWWAIQNEGVAPDEPTTGLFAMDDKEPPATRPRGVSEARQSRWRHGGKPG